MLSRRRLDFGLQKHVTERNNMSDALEVLLSKAKFKGVEAKAYLALLKAGNANLAEIVKAVGVSKTTVFEALESLRARKIVFQTKRKSRVVYRVISPERVIDLLRAEAHEQTAMIDDLMRALPLLQALHAGASAPTVIVKEGNDAIYGYFEHLEQIMPEELDEISSVTDILNWIDRKTLLDARRAYKWLPKKARALHSGASSAAAVGKGWERRLLNKAWGSFRGNLAVYGDYVSMVTYTKRLALIIIESKSLADSMRLLFNVAWRGSDDLE